jgi:hypothetical protein
LSVGLSGKATSCAMPEKGIVRAQSYFIPQVEFLTALRA